ncbi:EGF-like domain-containing protein [Pycnococcus provasolii]
MARSHDGFACNAARRRRRPRGCRAAAGGAAQPHGTHHVVLKGDQGAGHAGGAAGSVGALVRLGATVTPYSELLRSTGTRTRKLRVSFRAPPWAEIDAVRMLGDREMPPKLEVLGGGLHNAVQVGGIAHDSLKVTNQGTSLLVWELRQVSGFSTGLHPSATHGVLRGSSSLTLNITANATEMQMAGNFPHTMAMFGVFNRFAKSGSLPVATFRVTALAMPGHGSAAAEVSCYHGVAVQERADQPAVCRCLPGAYGTACEFLHCPNNCTGTI